MVKKVASWSPFNIGNVKNVGLIPTLKRINLSTGLWRKGRTFFSNPPKTITKRKPLWLFCLIDSNYKTIKVSIEKNGHIDKKSINAEYTVENKWCMKNCIHFPLLMTKSPLDILTIKMMKVLLLARILAFDAIVQTSTASFITPTSAPAARWRSVRNWIVILLQKGNKKEMWNATAIEMYVSGPVGPCTHSCALLKLHIYFFDIPCKKMTDHVRHTISPCGPALPVRGTN